MCLCMHVNGNVFSGCRTLDISLCNQEGKRSRTRATNAHVVSTILVRRHWSQPDKSAPHCLFTYLSSLYCAGHGHLFFQNAINMRPWVQLLIQNWFCRCQKQACVDRFKNICLAGVCLPVVLSSATELVLLRAKQNTKYNHVSMIPFQSLNGDKKGNHPQTFIFLCLSLFPPPCKSHRHKCRCTNKHGHSQPSRFFW